jgi:hypothetical protein
MALLPTGVATADTHSALPLAEFPATFAEVPVQHSAGHIVESKRPSKIRMIEPTAYRVCEHRSRETAAQGAND